MSNFDQLDELVNNTLNTNALLLLLNDKNLISSHEFNVYKDKAFDDFKSSFPELFTDNNSQKKGKSK